MHKPIHINNLSFSLPHKTCFDDFTTQVLPGSRIAIIGRNGSGKSTLLRMLHGERVPDSGAILRPDGLVVGYVPQVIEAFEHLSGGQRFNASLSLALSDSPDLLLLDEPTNHLDQRNRSSLIRMLNAYEGTLIIASHDVELLRQSIDIFWHIDNGQVHVFSGNYDDYRQAIAKKRQSIEMTLAQLQREKNQMHDALMKEQMRAAKSRAKGVKSIEQHKWPTIVSAAKAGRAQETTGRHKAAIDQKKRELSQSLSELSLPKVIVPRFSLRAADLGNITLLSITQGSIAYEGSSVLLQNINLSVKAGERIAILGDNGSGKSSLLNAILGGKLIIKNGEWVVPGLDHIGYLDQHYHNVVSEHSVLETIEALIPNATPVEVRRHLGDFLFFKNEEVQAKVGQLSGGEKARLSLAKISAKTPKLLILDEITNNLDLETREHVIQVLQVYPGAMLVISHDSDFLQAIGITQSYQIQEGYLVSKSVH